MQLLTDKHESKLSEENNKLDVLISNSKERDKNTYLAYVFLVDNIDKLLYYYRDELPYIRYNNIRSYIKHHFDLKDEEFNDIDKFLFKRRIFSPICLILINFIVSSLICWPLIVFILSKLGVIIGPGLAVLLAGCVFILFCVSLLFHKHIRFYRINKEQI